MSQLISQNVSQLIFQNVSQLISHDLWVVRGRCVATKFLNTTSTMAIQWLSTTAGSVTLGNWVIELRGQGRSGRGQESKQKSDHNYHRHHRHHNHHQSYTKPTRCLHKELESLIIADCITDKLTILQLILQHTNISKSHIVVRPFICLVHPTDDNIIEKLHNPGTNPQKIHIFPNTNTPAMGGAGKSTLTKARHPLPPSPLLKECWFPAKLKHPPPTFSHFTISPTFFMLYNFMQETFSGVRCVCV